MENPNESDEDVVMGNREDVDQVIPDRPPPNAGDETNPWAPFPLGEDFMDRSAPQVLGEDTNMPTFNTDYDIPAQPSPPSVPAETPPSPNVNASNGDSAINFGRQISNTFNGFTNSVTELHQDVATLNRFLNSGTGSLQFPQSYSKPRRQVPTAREPYHHPGPQSKDPVYNMKQSVIRNFVKQLLKVEDDILPPPPAPEAIQDLVNQVHGSGPSLETFLIDYNDRAQSHWNSRAFNIFIESLLGSSVADKFKEPEEQSGPVLDPSMRVQVDLRKRHQIYRLWVTHFHGLRIKYKNQLKEINNPLSKKKRLSAAARDSRRQALYDRRLTICQTVDQFKIHAPILQQLGPAGMSSDESSTDNKGVKSYTILAREWHAAGVKTFVRRLDETHRRIQNPGNDSTSRGGPGNDVHTRQDPLNHINNSTRQAVRYLPRVLYDSSWLARLDAIQRELLKPTGVDYDISFGPSRP